jgi:UDP-N-acetyl-D-glucosamine dehydrogenase
MNVAVVGLGYVGLPVALQFARSNVRVIGIDVDPAKVGMLNRGETYIEHIDTSMIKLARRNGRFEASTDFERIADVDAVIICVPTPLNRNRGPDLSYVLRTGEQIAPFLKRGALVVLESTSFPGTTDQELRSVLEDNAPFVDDRRDSKGTRSRDTEQPRRMKAGVDFHLAFSPEREDPGNAKSLSEIPKLVGGFTPKCRDRAVALYSKAIKTVIPVSSNSVAEAAKLLENIYRCVNIALVNELKVIYAAMGIDIWEVIEAAQTKPFGFSPFYPGPGMGGHCIPIDPFYLSWKAREFGKPTRFIELAGEINTTMPEYVVNRLTEALNSHRKTLNGSKILILGLAYKPNIDDTRESAAFVLMDLISARGATISYHDPHVPIIKPTREHGRWAGTKSIAWTRGEVRDFDAVLISTAHAAVNYRELADWNDCVVDTRNAMAKVATRPGQVWKG